MRLRSFVIITTLIVVAASAGFYSFPVAAQVMQSSSYQIESDSINIGGGLASSTNYAIEDTVGEQATGESNSSSYRLRAGYQQMQEVYLAITAAADVTMSNSIGGVTGGNATGSTMVTVTTDSRAGYQLSISASTSPAMQDGSNTIADYAPGVDPEFVFTTDASESHFGFSPEGSHVVDRFKDNGTDTCNTDTNETTDRCWDGLSTTPAPIAESNNSNHPAGTDTTIKFQVGVGGSVNQVPGTYVATTTLTLIAL
jgi:hypothetical protein